MIAPRPTGPLLVSAPLVAGFAAWALVVSLAAPLRPVAAAADDERPAWKAGESCVSSTCHAELRGQDHHGPIALRVCAPCHVSVDGTHTFRAQLEGADLCRHCHEGFFRFEGKSHDPVEKGQCTRCHDPHGGTGESFLLRKKVGGGLCFECHPREALLGGAKAHGPLQLGQDCSICHDPHASDHPKLLRRSGIALCVTCHEEIADLEAAGNHWHEPAEENCSGCHDPHSSNLPSHLRAPLPELCIGCHEEKRNQLQGERIHAALITPDRCTACHESAPPGGAEACPLVGEAGNAGRCLECHDPHASRNEHLLDASLMQSCLRCHDQPIEVAGRATIPSIRSQIEGKTHVHGPLAQGNCSACHEPHATDHWRLLKEEYPSEFYAPFTKDRYHLCFQCHDDALVLAAENRFATGFRDGSRNLHTVHVRSEGKGRSCRSCHEMHASNLPFQLRESVPFGQWDLPIQYEQLENGGRCTPGCHVTATYDRTKGVER